MPILIFALSIFVATHFLMSHPLRARMVARLGANGFQIAYSLVSLASFAWAIMLYRDLGAQSRLWEGFGATPWLVSILMLVAATLFAGSVIGNPALMAPGAETAAQASPKGMLAITRHPMMWSFALWSLAHILANPTPKMLALCSAMAFLALAGSAGQDRKKAVLMGADWQGWVAKTAYWPFAAQVSGRLPWGSMWPGFPVLLAGAILWLLASWLHPVKVGLFAIL
jgi:uncharacterized membrane protein